MVINNQEPKNSKEKNVCLGIDFGTTNSVCSVIINEKWVLLKMKKITNIPTIVYYKNGIKNLVTMLLKRKL